MSEFLEWNVLCFSWPYNIDKPIEGINYNEKKNYIFDNDAIVSFTQDKKSFSKVFYWCVVLYVYPSEGNQSWDSIIEETLKQFPELTKLFIKQCDQCNIPILIYNENYKSAERPTKFKLLVTKESLDKEIAYWKNRFERNYPQEEEESVSETPSSQNSVSRKKEGSVTISDQEIAEGSVKISEQKISDLKEAIKNWTPEIKYVSTTKRILGIDVELQNLELKELLGTNFNTFYDNYDPESRKIIRDDIYSLMVKKVKDYEEAKTNSLGYKASTKEEPVPEKKKEMSAFQTLPLPEKKEEISSLQTLKLATVEAANTVQESVNNILSFPSTIFNSSAPKYDVKTNQIEPSVLKPYDQRDDKEKENIQSDFFFSQFKNISYSDNSKIDIKDLKQRAFKYLFLKDFAFELKDIIPTIISFSNGFLDTRKINIDSFTLKVILLENAQRIIDKIQTFLNQSDGENFQNIFRADIKILLGKQDLRYFNYYVLAGFEDVVQFRYFIEKKAFREESSKLNISNVKKRDMMQIEVFLQQNFLNSNLQKIFSTNLLYFLALCNYYFNPKTLKEYITTNSKEKTCDDFRTQYKNNQNNFSIKQTQYFKTSYFDTKRLDLVTYALTNDIDFFKPVICDSKAEELYNLRPFIEKFNKSFRQSHSIVLIAKITNKSETETLLKFETAGFAFWKPVIFKDSDVRFVTINFDDTTPMNNITTNKYVQNEVKIIKDSGKTPILINVFHDEAGYSGDLSLKGEICYTKTGSNYKTAFNFSYSDDNNMDKINQLWERFY